MAYAKSMYAGSGNASTALAGEFIGILSGPDPEEVRSGLQAAFSLIENDAHFYEANEEGTVVYFAHCISRTGTYLSGQAGVPEGTPMAYLIAPAAGSFRGIRCGVKGSGCETFPLLRPRTESETFPLLRTANGDELWSTPDGKRGGAAARHGTLSLERRVCSVAQYPLASEKRKIRYNGDADGRDDEFVTDIYHDRRGCRRSGMWYGNIKRHAKDPLKWRPEKLGDWKNVHPSHAHVWIMRRSLRRWQFRRLDLANGKIRS